MEKVLCNIFLTTNSTYLINPKFGKLAQSYTTESKKLKPSNGMHSFYGLLILPAIFAFKTFMNSLWLHNYVSVLYQWLDLFMQFLRKGSQLCFEAHRFYEMGVFFSIKYNVFQKN